MRLSLLLSLFALSLSWTVHAKCILNDLEFEVILDQQTFDDAHLDGTSLFRVKDLVVIKDMKNLRTYKFELGTLEDDDSGNFNIQAINIKKNIRFNVFYDHENWSKGLEGSFSLPDGRTLELLEVKDCHFKKLFKLK